MQILFQTSENVYRLKKRIQMQNIVTTVKNFENIVVCIHYRNVNESGVSLREIVTNTGVGQMSTEKF